MGYPNNIEEKSGNLRILCLLGDLSGCHRYRIAIPNIELRRFGVEVTEVPYLPNNPGQPQLETVINFFNEFDMVVLQRSYSMPIARLCREATQFLGMPLVYETDDNYLDLEKDNPCYWALVPNAIFEQHQNNKAVLEHVRLQSLEEYKEIISMMDLITVTTPELKQVLYPYNKNIEILPNNVLSVYRGRTYDPEQNFIKNGKLHIEMDPNINMGLMNVPAYFIDETNKALIATPRIGYTGTPSHIGQDFDTIKQYWYRLIEKYSKNCWFNYIGSDYFYKEHMLHQKSKGVNSRAIHFPPAQYELYMFNLRNLDIGIAPLAPTIFNMAKSDIKPIELACFGSPSVLPNYITYNRTFVDGETALFYNNGREFMEAMDTLINDSKLRAEIGFRAQEYVRKNRLERDHAERRYLAYKKVVESRHRLPFFKPNKEKAIVA